MWLGEQMTEHGIGNGMSTLIFAGIVARIPIEIGRMIGLLKSGSISLFQVLFFVVINNYILLLYIFNLLILADNFILRSTGTAVSTFMESFGAIL